MKWTLLLLIVAIISCNKVNQNVADSSVSHLSDSLSSISIGITPHKYTIVVMGSSTAFGYASTNWQDSSWVGRLRRHYQHNKSTDTAVIDIAVPGYTTYQEMPTGFVHPYNRPAPDTAHNASKAMLYKPDIVIINLPNNDVIKGYTNTEVLNNFKTLYQYFNRNWVRCFIATPQPRNDISTARKLELVAVKDSIQKLNFYSIDFWSPIATTNGTMNLRDQVRDLGKSDSCYHLNNCGHRLIYQQVANHDIWKGYTYIAKGQY